MRQVYSSILWMRKIRHAELCNTPSVTQIDNRRAGLHTLSHLGFPSCVKRTTEGTSEAIHYYLLKITFHVLTCRKCLYIKLNSSDFLLTRALQSSSPYTTSFSSADYITLPLPMFNARRNECRNICKSLEPQVLNLTLNLPPLLRPPNLALPLC